MEQKTINDFFPDWASGDGIISALESLGNTPWETQSAPYPLDLEYHGNISGEKIASPLLVKIADSGDYLEWIARTISAIYLKNWIKQWETLFFEYNPIENYSMEEKMDKEEITDTYGKINTRTNNLSHGKTGTEQNAPDLTDTVTPNLTTNTNNSVYGFNSTEGVPSDAQAQTSTGTNTNRRTGTDTTTYNTTETDTGTQRDENGGTDKHERTYNLTRTGNIGVTTSQQMIQSERDLWKWNYFHDTVFPDIDKVLALQIY